jgi:hypothetical protein
VEQDKQPKSFIVRYVPKDWAAPAVAGVTIVAFLYGVVEGKAFDVPAQTIGAALTTGSTASTSASIGTFTLVADTSIDREYQAWYATLRSDVEQGGSTKEVRWFFPSTQFPASNPYSTWRGFS